MHFVQAPGPAAGLASDDVRDDGERSKSMAELVHDPVNRVRYAFQRDGENLIVDCLVDSGGSLPAHHGRRTLGRKLP